MYIYIYVYKCIYILVYVSIYVCIYIHRYFYAVIGQNLNVGNFKNTAYFLCNNIWPENFRLFHKT